MNLTLKYFENYDTKLLSETDNYNLKLTTLGYYKLLKSAEDFFTRELKKCGDENYVKSDGLKTVIDYEETEKKRGKYASQFRFYDEKWEEYRENHLDEFDESIMINTHTETNTKVYDCDYHFSSSELFEGYAYVKKELKRFEKGEDGYDLLPKTERYTSKKEFKEKHSQFLNDLRKQLRLPDEETLKVYKEVEGLRLKVVTQKIRESATDEVFKLFVPAFLKQISE